MRPFGTNYPSPPDLGPRMDLGTRDSADRTPSVTGNGTGTGLDGSSSRMDTGRLEQSGLWDARLPPSLHRHPVLLEAVTSRGTAGLDGLGLDAQLPSLHGSRRSSTDDPSPTISRTGSISITSLLTTDVRVGIPAERERSTSPKKTDDNKAKKERSLSKEMEVGPEELRALGYGDAWFRGS
jgi:hypothetical protein